jgi:diguanylate cyclase (GGDEF)-like protein
MWLFGRIFSATHLKKSLLFISLIMLSLDGAFVVLNYYSSRAALHANLVDRAQKHQKEFGFTLQMTYRNMMQMSQFISYNDELNQIFLQGKKAVEAAGGGSGGEDAERLRQELLKKVQPSWDKLMRDFDVRQLHYQFGPGSLSFLRVHKPLKYGDRMDDIRYTIVDTNAEKTSRSGFETGRIYSGLRSVSPVWATDPDSQKQVYVGALEVGTSFDQLLPLFSGFHEVSLAVLLTKNHVESKMWPEFIAKYFAENPDLSYYLESSSSRLASAVVPFIVKKLELTDNYVTPNVQLIENGEGYLSAYYFPLRDYRGERDRTLAPAGFVLVWEDVSPLVAAFRSAVWANILYAVFGFILLEVVLLWFFRQEVRLTVAEKEATVDGLTGIYNRRYFDRHLKKELNNARRFNLDLALLMADVDYFKKYNDCYGHQAGDHCLVAVAKAIATSLNRGSDWPARYGGEEFVVVLPATDLSGALLVANNVRLAVAELNIEHAESSVAPHVTLSLGVASLRTLAASEELLSVADQHLYCAKEQGRNRIYGGDSPPAEYGVSAT